MSVSDINRVWPLFLAGLVTVSLNSTAYLAEVLRGGILAVDAGQMEAARSLGMTHWQAMRKVVFPQAIKNSLPAIGNEFIINIKDSSVLCVVGVSDLMFMTRSVAGIYYKGTECYLIAAIVYLFLTYLSSLLLKAITGNSACRRICHFIRSSVTESHSACRLFALFGRVLALTYNHITSDALLTTEYLYTESLCCRLTTVLRTADTFFMCHFFFSSD